MISILYLNSDYLLPYFELFYSSIKIWGKIFLQFNYETIIILMILSFLIVIMLVKFIYRHNPQYDDEYGKDIILFHYAERYVKRVWIFNIIKDMKKLKAKGTN